METIEEGILEAETVNTLDLSKNKIRFLPEFLAKLDPKKIKIENNLLKQIDPPFILFANLKEISLKKNKISSFLENLNPQQMDLMKENFLYVNHLDLSQNNLFYPPSNLYLMENLVTLLLGYNKIEHFD